MAWIESHIDLGDHPKVVELCFHLGIKKHEAIGHLHLLWHFTMKYAWRDGDLRRFTPRAIAQAVDWDKDADTLILNLQATGWLEKDSLQIHDWLEYSGKLVKDRLYNEERRKTALNAVTSRKTSATLPYPTLPNQKKETTTTGVAFEEFYSLYPKKQGKEAALKAWGKAFKDASITSESWKLSVKPALRAQCASEQWRKENGKYVPLPATWINGKRWQDEVESIPKESSMLTVDQLEKAGLL